MATAATFAITAGVVLTLTGCSSAGSGSPVKAAAGGSPASTPSTTPATTAAAAQGKLDGLPTACPSADEVMSNLHLSKLVVSGDDPALCEYLFNGDKSSPYAVITFNTAPGLTPDQLKTGLTQGQTNVQAVPGLADAADSFTVTAGGFGLTFLSGSTVCTIATTVPTTVADEVALANVILQG